jgi:branched-chain amino acid transport system substrate-binding protein
MTKPFRALILSAAAAALLAGAPAAAQVKIAYIDPLSGPLAPIGEMGVRQFQFLIERINAAGGVAGGKKLELVTFDNKVNPQETLVQLQKAIDQGIRIVTQGNGSSVAAAISDFVTKYNERNPGKEVLYLNYAAVDPVLTNDKCSFWHFRWDANSDIKMEALTNFMKTRPNIKKIYLINQDYSFGHAVRKAAVEMIKAKRPDIQIVGDELHPLARVTDFAPYVAKIKASGADSVITGNWGSDFALLLKAAADAGLQTEWYTYYAGGAGGPVAIQQAKLGGKVFQIAEGSANLPGANAGGFEEEYRKRSGGQSFWYPRARNQMEMLAAAMNKANSVEPKAIAMALRGMRHKSMYGGEGFMRADDHQYFQDMYIAGFGPLSGDAKFDEEKTGWGWTTIAKIEAKDTIVPTTCKMQVPK